MTEKQLQTEAQNKLRAEGWTWWFPPRTWGERDIFGVFDFLAVKNNKTIFVQITTLDHISHRRRKIQSFFDLVNAKIPNVFIWGYDKKAGKFKVVKM